jgi:alpha-galactosidase
MELPGFHVYRQDCNLGQPALCWDAADAPDRQGIAEIKHITGLYSFWRLLHETFPDALMEGCSGGGRRLDLETISHFHMHQKTDYWFDYESDQTSLWGLSQFLPNGCVVAHLRDLDDYSFHSTLASSMCLGWIADDPQFDTARARELVERYKRLRHLLIGAWYPLVPFSASKGDWLVSQYHRADLGEGLVLALRRSECPYPSVEFALQALEPDAKYELSFDTTGQKLHATGADLMTSRRIELDDKKRSELMRYRKVGTAAVSGTR